MIHIKGIQSGRPDNEPPTDEEVIKSGKPGGGK